jgi:ActR/RegA family two-component response regulator
VLTVENDPIVRTDLRLALEDAGFEVVAHAADGSEAVELARDHTPDVIVLDPALPAGDAVEALAESEATIVELPRPFAPSLAVEAVTGALAERSAREIRDSRSTSLRSIATLVDQLSFATPSAAELEQASWERGHVWRIVELPSDRTE